MKKSNYDEGEMDMNCQDFEEMLGAYVLEALSDEERQAADIHLTACSKCRHTVEQLRAIVGLFPLSVPAIEPPPRLKAQIIARIQTDQAFQNPSSPPDERRARSHKRQLRWDNTLLAATILLLLVVVGGMGLWNLSLHQQVTQLSTRVSPPITYAIHGVHGSAATGEVIYYPQQHITVLTLRDLPQLPGTQVYQGWVFQGKKPISIGLLNRENDIATLDFQGELERYNATAVSLERGPRASSTPKGPVVALGSLQGP